MLAKLEIASYVDFGHFQAGQVNYAAVTNRNQPGLNVTSV